MRNGVRRIEDYAGGSPSQPGERRSDAIGTASSSSVPVSIRRTPIPMNQKRATERHRRHIQEPPSYDGCSNDVSLYIRQNRSVDRRRQQSFKTTAIQEPDLLGKYIR